MTKEYNRNEELQSLIKKSILEIDDIIEKKQLELILCELKKMNISDNCLLTFPHMLIDSWDGDKHLSNLLLSYATSYEKERKKKYGY